MQVAKIGQVVVPGWIYFGSVRRAGAVEIDLQRAGAIAPVDPEAAQAAVNSRIGVEAVFLTGQDELIQFPTGQTGPGTLCAWLRKADELGFNVDWLGGFDRCDCVELTWIHFHAAGLRLTTPRSKLKQVAVDTGINSKWRFPFPAL